MPNRLVLCLDGTWNSNFKPVDREDGTKVLKPANPLKIARAILPTDQNGNRQITYYDSGVGALGLYPGFSNRLLYFFDSKLGGGFGAGFEANVEQAANFIAMNYSEGDELYIFGFSRGAAQARALTNFLGWLGGIPAKRDAYYVPIFFRHYLDNKGKGTPMDVQSSTGDVPAKRLQPLIVTLLGVWDTVMALGSRLRASVKTSVVDRAFHIKPEPAACVKHARQALAIDERRFDFRPEIWQSGEESQTLEQRWFPGAHGNVGGSYGNDGLANSALHWIADEATTLGLAIDNEFLAKYRPFAQDELGISHDLFYKTSEALRFKLGHGTRSLVGHPDTAQLLLDSSVIKRFCSDPKDFSKMAELYRPKNVVRMVAAHQKNWSTFLQNYGMDPETYPFPKDV